MVRRSEERRAVPRRRGGVDWRLLASAACVVAAIVWLFSGRIGAAPPVPEDLDALDPDVAALVREGVSAVAAARRDHRLWLQLGMIYEANALFPFARACYERATGLDADDPEGWRRLAVTAERLSDMETARRAMAAAIERDDRHVASCWQLGLWALDEGELDEAERRLRRAVELSPQAQPAWYGLARLHLARRQPQAAADLIVQQGLIDGPNAPFFYRLLGTAYRNLGRIDEAEAALAQASVTLPKFGVAWTRDLERWRRGVGALRQDATTLLVRGDVERAIPLLEELCVREPGEPRHANELAQCYIKLGRNDEALSRLRAVLALDPDDYDANMNTAVVLLASADADDLESALAHADRAVAARPSGVRARRVRAAALVQLGRHDEAIAALEAIFAEDARDVTPLFEAAVLEMRRERWAEAADRFRRILEHDPREPRTVTALAQCLFEADDLDGAEQTLADADEIPGIDVTHVERLRARIEAARRARPGG
jgi:tetratricopeptide (TPR) repeat protein